MPDVKQLRDEVDHDRRLGHVLLWLLLLATLGVVLRPWGPEPWAWAHPTLTWVGNHWLSTGWLVLAALTFSRAAYRAPLPGKATPIDEASGEQLGRFDLDTVRRAFQDVVNRLKDGRRETPGLFLVDIPDGNAAAVNSYFLYGSRAKNAVYVSTFLLRVLSLEELTALFGHEIEHFYRCQNPLLRAPLVVSGAAVVFVLTVAAAFFQPSSWVFTITGSVFVLMPAFLALLVGVTLFARRKGHLHELLADLAGAQVSSPEAMINLLLRLGARQEVVFRAIEEAVRRAGEHPDVEPEGLVKLVNEALPQDPIDEETARRVVREALSARHPSNAPSRRLRRAEARRRATLLKKMADAFGRDESWRVLSWQLFDTHVPDGRLDATEIRELAASLSKDEEAMLFAVVHDLGGPPRLLEHPTFRRRVFFVAEATGLAER